MPRELGDGEVSSVPVRPAVVVEVEVVHALVHGRTEDLRMGVQAGEQ